MSYTLRSRTVARDNISVGNATGKERTILGNAGSTQAYRGLEQLISSSGGASTDVAIEHFILGTTDQTHDLP